MKCIIYPYCAPYSPSSDLIGVLLPQIMSHSSLLRNKGDSDNRGLVNRGETSSHVTALSAYVLMSALYSYWERQWWEGTAVNYWTFS